MKRWLLILMMAITLSACSSGVEKTPVEIDPVVIVDPTPMPTLTPTLEPLKSLTVCASKLPDQLFPFDGVQTSSKSNLLSLLYEPAFVIGEGSLTSGILEKIPTSSDGGLQLQPVAVQRGQTVVDVEGALVVLKEGVRVRPAGCQETECAITWDGQDPLEMDQLVVDFVLKTEFAWSDGEPLTARDSQFAFQVANDPSAPGLKWVEDRTGSYTAIDDHNLQWVGKPGFTTPEVETLFWTPLPSHVLSLSEGWDELVNEATALRGKPSYGPFAVFGYDDGLLRLILNPNYDRAPQDLPKLDEIVFRQVDGGLQAAWSALQAGECDVLDTSFNLAGSPEILAEIGADDRYDLLLEEADSWTQIVLGIKPASYDDYYNPQMGDRPDILGDARARQAIMHCLDRDALLESTLGGLTQVWPSFLPQGKSRMAEGGSIIFDPQTGRDLLQEVGWIDHDGNPETPLLAYYVVGVPVNTPMALELLGSPSGFHRDLAGAIQGQLGACGIGVTVTVLPEDTFYAPGPQGVLFGRQFDLALISWQPHPGLDCQLYQSSAIPRNANQWIGTNIAGFEDNAYDRACQNALLSLPDSYDETVRLAEETYLEHLPAIPLFSVPETMVIPSEACLGAEIETVSDFFAQLPGLNVKDTCR